MSINLENVVLASPEQMEFIIQGMRNPMNSWEKSDTCFSDESCVNCYYSQRNLCDKDSFLEKDEKLGSNDHSLMQRLSNAGTEHDIHAICVDTDDIEGWIEIEKVQEDDVKEDKEA